MRMVGRTRREWPEKVKRQIVAETYAHGASVAEAAPRHGNNANLVFIWRMDPRFNPRLARTGLLPVKITRSNSNPDTHPVLNARQDVPGSDTCTEPASIEIALSCGVRLTCAGAGLTRRSSRMSSGH